MWFGCLRWLEALIGRYQRAVHAFRRPEKTCEQMERHCKEAVVPASTNSRLVARSQCFSSLAIVCIAAKSPRTETISRQLQVNNRIK
jgi:hypothetical protein